MLENMPRRIFEFCLVIAVSIAVVHSGVAWALAKCARDDGHSNHAASEHPHDLQAPANDSDSETSKAPVIHCATVTAQIGPATPAAASRLARSDDSVPLQAFLVPRAVSTPLRNNVGLKILTFSLPAALPRHLFLSVLQI